MQRDPSCLYKNQTGHTETHFPTSQGSKLIRKQNESDPKAVLLSQTHVELCDTAGGLSLPWNFKNGI